MKSQGFARLGSVYDLTTQDPKFESFDRHEASELFERLSKLLPGFGVGEETFDEHSRHELR